MIEGCALNRVHSLNPVKCFSKFTDLEISAALSMISV